MPADGHSTDAYVQRRQSNAHAHVYIHKIGGSCLHSSSALSPDFAGSTLPTKNGGFLNASCAVVASRRVSRHNKCLSKVPSFLNVSWPGHGSKGFRIGCPGSFPKRRAESRKLLASKTAPAVSGLPFPMGASAHSVFENAALSVAAAVGAVAHAQGSFGGHLLCPPSLTNCFQFTV